MAEDTRKFRNALGCFATGVAVITAKAEGQAPIGITVNSFSSVSLDPPLILWSLDKKSDTMPIFAAVETFRSEEHTSELQSLMRISYAVFCLKKKNKKTI